MFLAYRLTNNVPICWLFSDFWISLHEFNTTLLLGSSNAIIFKVKIFMHTDEYSQYISTFAASSRLLPFASLYAIWNCCSTPFWSAFSFDRKLIWFMCSQMLLNSVGVLLFSSRGKWQQRRLLGASWPADLQSCGAVRPLVLSCLGYQALGRPAITLSQPKEERRVQIQRLNWPWSPV